MGICVELARLIHLDIFIPRIGIKPVKVIKYIFIFMVY